MSYNLYSTIMCSRIYHGVCWGISLIFTIIPLAAGKYGPAITWWYLLLSIFSVYLFIIVIT